MRSTTKKAIKSSRGPLVNKWANPCEINHTTPQHEFGTCSLSSKISKTFYACQWMKEQLVVRLHWRKWGIKMEKQSHFRLVFSSHFLCCCWNGGLRWIEVWHELFSIYADDKKEEDEELNVVSTKNRTWSVIRRD